MRKKWLKKERIIAQVLLLFIGLTLIFIPSVIPAIGSPWNLLMFGLATSMMATIILSILEYILGSDIPTLVANSLIFNKEVYDKGLEAVNVGFRGGYDLASMFEHAHYIDTMHNTAKTLVNLHGRHMMTAIETYGCEIRILIADSNNIIFGNKNLTDGLCPETNIPNELTETVSYLKYLIDELKKSKPLIRHGSIEIREYPNIPTCSLVIVDRKFVRHVPYLPYFHSSDVPAYDIVKERGGRLYEKYERAFAHVWDHSRLIFEEHWPKATSH